MTNSALGLPWDSKFSRRLRKYKHARIFAAIPFNGSHSQQLWKIIESIADENEYEVARTDESAHTRLVIDAIYEEIQRARIVIVDLTDLNANVIYELGFAHAYHSAVLLVCREGQELPFDITGFQCIFFELSSLPGRKKFRAALSAAFEAVQDPDEPAIIRGKLNRTESICNDLSALKSLPADVLRDECVWLNGFLSALAISEDEQPDSGDEEYREALLKEKSLLLQLARASCPIKMILTPPSEQHFIPDKKTVSIERLRTLLAILRDLPDPALENIAVVISPYRQKSLYIIGHICMSEGFKLGLSRGYELTLRQSDYDAISASIKAQAILFDELKTHTIVTYPAAQDTQHDPLRACAIRALEQSLLLCEA